MAFVLQLDEEQSRRLAAKASELNVDPAELANAAINELISRPTSDFDQAANDVLQKNQELYRRLSQ
jgi:hypothetical protein